MKRYLMIRPQMKPTNQLRSIRESVLSRYMLSDDEAMYFLIPYPNNCYKHITNIGRVIGEIDSAVL